MTDKWEAFCKDGKALGWRRRMTGHHNADVSKMICGPEIDKLLAEAIGWTGIRECDGKWLGWMPKTPTPPVLGKPPDIHFVNKYRKTIPAYSTSSRAAWDWIKAWRYDWGTWCYDRDVDCSRDESGDKYKITLWLSETMVNRVFGEGDTFPAALVEAVVVYDYCTPLRLNYCWQIKPAIAAILAKDTGE